MVNKNECITFAGLAGRALKSGAVAQSVSDCRGWCDQLLRGTCRPRGRDRRRLVRLGEQTRSAVVVLVSSSGGYRSTSRPYPWS